MTQSDETTEQTKRRPRVVVLGEFSSGKSTLINLLTGGARLQTQVTATQRPAIWLSYGAEAPFRVDLRGERHPVDLDDPATMPTKTTAYVRAFLRTPALELCDFIDTPGNSDPNIPASAWEQVAQISDVAVWCSPSTQAWRLSELSAWSDVPQRVRQNSLLLLTRADKLASDQDREKVLSRVKREAGECFTKVHMLSLLDFSEAEAFLRDLIRICQGLDGGSMAGPVSDAQVLAILRQSIQGTRQSAAASEEAGESFEGAMELWLSLTEAVPEENYEEALGDAFETFKRKIDDRLQAPGFAAELWSRLTDSLAEDDDEGLQDAFQRFVEHADRALSKRAPNAMRGAG